MARRRVTGLALVVFAALFTIAVPPAQATFPGPNGQIAFSSARNGDPDIWVMNSDGSGQRSVTGQGADEGEPAWAPHQRGMAFTREGESDLFVIDAEGSNEQRVNAGNHYAYSPAWSPDGSQLAFGDFAIYVMDANGSDAPREISDVWAPEMHAGPDWAPDGETIVFSRGAQGGDRYGCWMYGNLTLVDPAGTTETLLANEPEWLDSGPSFSPGGETVVFSRQPNPCYGPRPGGPADLYTVPVAGGTPTQLTDTPEASEERPAWSPDGTKIAFSATVDGNTDIYVMNADGSGRQRLTTDAADDNDPSWGGSMRRPPGFPRPQSAPRVEVPLVPAYRECTVPNRQHGPPLAYGSCSPPEGNPDPYGIPSNATFGTHDVNGFAPRSSGRMLLRTIMGDPSTAADEADVSIKLRLTDVRQRDNPAADYQPYEPYLRVLLYAQLTDKDNGCCGQAGTLQDQVQLNMEALCTPTPDTGVGSTCSLATTADSVIPGMVREGKRAVWELRKQVQVYDSDWGLLAVPGLFVP